MNYQRVLIAITLAAGLGACASSPDYGLRYEDGSYYSPAGEGRGDYYVGADLQHSYYLYDDFDLFFGHGYGGWYGSPFYSYGGYCSVRYRYCPRWAWGGGFGSHYGETGFDIYFGSPWDPYWGGGYYPGRHHRGHRPAGAAQGGEQANPDWAPRPRQTDTRRPRPRPEPVTDDESERFPFPSPASERRPSPRRTESAPAPPPRPRPKSERGDGN
jgi:hypothetical protein